MATATPATKELATAQVSFTVHPYETDAAADASDGYGRQAAAALGVSPEQLFKTLIATVDGDLVCAVVPVAGQLDLKALARAVGGKRAAMADPAAAQRATGYVLGGISPLGQRTRLPVVIDESALSASTVFVSAGRRGLQVSLAPADLVRITSAKLAHIRA